MNNKIPQHIAIIMDGNGRWAKKNSKSRIEGHRAGVNSVKKIIQKSLDLGIKKLTLYTFSNDNWKRPKIEVDSLLKLFSNTIKSEFSNLKDNGVKVSFVGDLSKFSNYINDLSHNLKNETSNNVLLDLNIALGYSGRQEIIYATKKISEMVMNKKLEVNDINEEIFTANLYDCNHSAPDLLIRSGGEHRISDFLLWQIAYSEIYVSEKFWPDFDENDFSEAINDFSCRERRFGKISEQL